MNAFQMKYMQHYMGSILEYAIALKTAKLKSFSKLAKTYKAKTNNRGKATFKIKKLIKKGTYKTTVTFKGNKYYNKIVKKVKIKIR